MADITMCVNKYCDMRNTCYRFRAKPSDHQSYCNFGKYKNGECEYYIEYVPHSY